MTDDDLPDTPAPGAETPRSNAIRAFENDYLRVFSYRTTFEKALVIPDLLPALRTTCEEFGYTEDPNGTRRRHRRINTRQQGCLASYPCAATGNSKLREARRQSSFRPGAVQKLRGGPHDADLYSGSDNLADGGMILTQQQRNAVTHDENTLLEACPGSGKTRAIVAKILRCLEDVRDTPRKIAVITYTNIAVNEIESRLRRYSSSQDIEYIEVSTIHSFCIGNILNSFYWRLEDYPQGFRLLAHEDAEYAQIVADIIRIHGLDPQTEADFQSLIRDAQGNPYVTRASGLTVAAVRAFWEELRKISAMDFATSIYLTYRILRDRPSLARALSLPIQMDPR